MLLGPWSLTLATLRPHLLVLVNQQKSLKSLMRILHIILNIDVQTVIYLGTHGAWWPHSFRMKEAAAAYQWWV